MTNHCDQQFNYKKGKNREEVMINKRKDGHFGLGQLGSMWKFCVCLSDVRWDIYYFGGKLIGNST